MGKRIPSVTVVATDRYYIPEDRVDPAKLESLYHKTVFNDGGCRRCEYREERLCDACLDCENLVGDFTFWNTQDIDGEPHVGVPVGNHSALKSLMEGYELELDDRRAKGRKLHPDLEFDYSLLHKYQKKAIRDLKEKGHGQLESPPRSGKTVMGSALIFKIGRKAIILVHQEDLAEQFIETLRSKKPKFTNIPAIEKMEKRELVGIARKYEQFKQYDICVCTYQTFLAKRGKKLLKKIRRLFGVVMVDEVHRSGASGYAKVINSFEARHRFGLSGTIERKDGRHVLPRFLIGPVTHKTEVETMAPKVDVMDTGFTSNKNYNLWTYAMRALEKDQKRTELIVKEAVKMMKSDGGRSILIPVAFVNQAIQLRDLINRAMGKKVAIEFTGRNSKKQRRQTILDAREGKWKCVIAMRQLLTGVNVPIWSGLLEAMPMNNPPNFVQEFNRVCTPCPGKPTPFVKFLIDDFAPSRSCVINMYDVLVQYSNSRKRKGQKPLEFTRQSIDVLDRHRALKNNRFQAQAKKAGNWDAVDDPKPYRSTY